MSSRSNPAKKEKVIEITTKPNWLELPRDITTNILQRLGAFTILTTARRVCSLWWNICKDPFMWRTIDMGMKHIDRLPQIFQNFDSLIRMFRYAVDLSCGQLEDISIYVFATNDLLNYIVDRTNHLRRIELDYCWGVSDEGICKISKKLSLVEKLHIRAGYYEHDLEVLGRSFPLLKSLTYVKWQTFLECDEDAFVIAKTMPRLRYLDINGNSLTDVGLTVILDGCPLLESLNIRRCPNLYFSGNLWKRCLDQIIDLHYDFDVDSKIYPTDDENEG